MTLRAIDLASRGIGLVSPSPLVGCVIVGRDGNVAGEGFYTFDGVTHAEIRALSQAGEHARGGTAYVSLEPHDHHGKTPPCTDALIEAGISRVVCPIEDPNPLVSGRGFESLRNAGVEVVTGLAAAEGAKLNEKFICWHTKHRPFVHLKLAMSLDGRISLDGSVSTALSGPEAIQRVHAFRHEHDAILVGGNTAMVDDPSLTDRSGGERRRKLVRVILDNRLRITSTLQIVATARETPTIVFTTPEQDSRADELRKHGVEVIASLSGGGRDLDGVLAELRSRAIQSVLVEGGTEIAGSFCDARLVDKLTFIEAPLLIGGKNAPLAIGGRGTSPLDSALKIADLSVKKIGDDIEITGYPTAA